MGEEFAKVVRDPIYGYIGLTVEQIKIVNLPVFQRLRRVSQLSFADLVYPNATHTRFSHSLGVMELARRAGAYIKAVYASIEPEYLEAIEWAGLLHDIGHFPFSHAFEVPAAEFVEERESEPKDFHVEWTKKILKDERLGIEPEIPGEILELVTQLIDKNARSKYKILDDTLSGYFSIDRLDYLKRDAYHAGTPEYAIIDIDRLIRSPARHEDRRVSVYKKKHCFALEGAILSYFYMYRAMYYHHAVRAAYLLFQNIVWDAFENNEIFHIDDWLAPAFWCDFDDPRCLTRLTEEPSVRDKMDLLLKRVLPKIISGEELYGPNADEILRLCQTGTYRQRVSFERGLSEALRGNWGNLVLLFLDSPVLVPYEPSPLALDFPYIWSGSNEDPIIPFHKVAPHLKELAETSERARVYVSKVWDSPDSKQRFIDDLNDAIQAQAIQGQTR